MSFSQNRLPLLRDTLYAAFACPVASASRRVRTASVPASIATSLQRTKARAAFAMKDLEAAMAGIEFRRSKVLLDEIPGAYKDIDHVMENARDLVRIDHTLRQIINCKGD